MNSFDCVSAVLKAVSNVNDIIAPALVGKVGQLVVVSKQSLLQVSLFK